MRHHGGAPEVRPCARAASPIEHLSRGALLPTTRGIYAREGEKVDHPEIPGHSTACGRQHRPPAAVRGVGIRVELQEPDDDLADDPSTYRSQVQPTGHEIGFLQDVEPERRRLVEA